MRRTWKWMALVGAGALMLQLNACVVDAAYTLAQSLVTQVLANIVRQALTGTTA